QVWETGWHALSRDARGVGSFAGATTPLASVLRACHPAGSRSPGESIGLFLKPPRKVRFFPLTFGTVSQATEGPRKSLTKRLPPQEEAPIKRPPSSDL